MTRLEFAQRNGVGPLFERASTQILALVQKIEEAGDGYGRFTKQMWLAGNSAVSSFVARLPVETLALAPYVPASMESQSVSLNGMNLTTQPLLNSFVGGDLFSGLFFLWHEGRVGRIPWILMDVGTNSEILFWDTEKLFVSSTPAGPAFEGSSISIGMRAENGSIIHPRWREGGWHFSVIGEDLPKGICGSALIEMVDEGVRGKLICDDGEVLRTSELKLSGDLQLTQDDVREFQLAKSAIQTGLELVIEQSPRKPEILFLAGSFGENLDLPACQRLGLLPLMRTETLGNSSLRGTILWGQAEPDERSRFQTWLNKVKQPVELATSDGFQSAFVRNMTLSAERQRPVEDNV